MCPVCFANLALVAVGATSGGGLTAFALNKFCRKKQTHRTKGRENETSRERNGSRDRIGSRVAGRAQGFTDARKGIHTSARCAQCGASQAAHGQDRQGISVRWAGG